MVFKTLAWGIAVGILQQQFHSFVYFDFINDYRFGILMIAMSLLAICNFFWKQTKIILMFLLFILFQMSFVTVGYLLNRPTDGAWARNFVEVIAILFLIRKLRFNS